MMSTLSLFVVTCTLCALVLSQQDPQYRLIVERAEPSSQGSRLDLITLRCRDTHSSRNFEPVQDINFWLNRTAPDDPGFQNDPNVITTRDRMGITFQLARDREGYYSCGVQSDSANVVESERIAVIALQTFFSSLLFDAMTTFFVASGGTAVLRCPVQPGSLYSYYYGEWTRNGTTIIEIPQPSRDGVAGEIMKSNTGDILDLDRETFSLTIRSVTRSQASNEYRCILRNFNLASGNSQEFTQATSLNISLMVNEAPTILKGPEPFIIGLQNATTNRPTFTCMVGGAPEPSLVWTYIPSLDDDRSELLLDGNKYDIISNTTREENGRFVVSKTVTFLLVTNTDGGIVRCNTGSDPNITHADALLTVLGTADDIDVIVSRDNDIIYELEFPTEIQHPVTLNITYTSEEGATDCRVPDVRYNTRTISYKEIVSEVPFPVYFVSIALVGVNGSQRITGPPTASGEKIDTTMPDPVKHIATILGSVLAVFIAAMMITIVAVIVFCYKQKELKLKYTKAIFDDPDKYTQYLKTKEEKNDFMRKVLKRHVKRIGADGEDDGEEEDLTDVLTQFLFESAVEGLNSDKNKYKEKFVEAVKRQVKDLHTEDREHPKSKDEESESPKSKCEESKSPTDQIGAESTKDEEPSRYHAGRDVSHDKEIKMSPEMSHTPIRVNRIIKESAV